VKTFSPASVGLFFVNEVKNDNRHHKQLKNEVNNLAVEVNKVDCHHPRLNREENNKNGVVVLVGIHKKSLIAEAFRVFELVFRLVRALEVLE
jgi:AmiR/NasT family two-component response regulator